jgi:hypothetical protein
MNTPPEEIRDGFRRVKEIVLRLLDCQNPYADYVQVYGVVGYPSCLKLTIPVNTARRTLLVLHTITEPELAHLLNLMRTAKLKDIGLRRKKHGYLVDERGAHVGLDPRIMFLKNRT